MNDIFDDVYVDIDKTPRAFQKTGLGLGASVLDSSDERASHLSDQNEPRTQLGRAVSEVDLSELQDEEGIGLQVRGLNSSSGKVLTILRK